MSKVVRDASVCEADGGPGTRNESLHGRHCFPNTAHLPTSAAF